MELKEVIAHNHARQNRARQLNDRAGAKIFPVMNREEIAQWLRERLGGARRVVEVKSPDALEASFTPFVDASELAVVGKMLKVEYRAGLAPRIWLDGELVSAHRWRELPDAGVKLPGGRGVEVVVSYGFYDSVNGQTIPDLKVRCAERANKQSWDGWTVDKRPVIGLPDLGYDDSVIAGITEAVYGQSVVDDAPLKAYGTVAVNASRYYSSEPQLAVSWFKTRAEAETARAAAVVKFGEIRKAAAEQKRLADASNAANAIKAQLAYLTGRQGWYEMESGLRSRVDEGRYAYLPSVVEEIHRWTQEASVLLTEAEVAFKSVADRKAAEEQAKRAAEARRDGILEKIRNQPYPTAHVLVREDGTALICCGKAGKMGRFDVVPAIGERDYSDGISIDPNGKVSVWQAIPVGQTVTARDFSGGGNVNWEITFTVPSGLSAGVWAVAHDNGKVVFYPTVYYRSRQEVIPMNVQVVASTPSPKAVALPTRSKAAEVRPVASTGNAGGFGGLFADKLRAALKEGK